MPVTSRTALLFASVLTLSACASTRSSEVAPTTAQFEEITVQRINVVGPDGSLRVVLANEDLMPLPIMDGDTVAARSIAPAGVLFYTLDGDEAGGIAVSEHPERGTQVASIFDYSNSDGLAVGVQDVGEAGYGALIGIRDRQPLGVPIAELPNGSAGPMRVMMINQNGTAMLMLNDGEERPRIRLIVTEQGDARVEVLDAEGNVVDSLPRSE